MAGVATIEAIAPEASRSAPQRHIVGGALVAACTLVVLAVSLATHTVPPLSPTGAVLAGVIALFAIGGVAALRARIVGLGWLVTVGSLLGAVGFAAARRGASHASHAAAWRELATVCVLVVMALSIHVLLSLPDGRLVRPTRRVVVVLGYAAALAAGLGLASSSKSLPPIAATVGWFVAVALCQPAVYSRYQGDAAAGRQRLQWLGTGAMLGTEVVLVAGTLSLLVHWPNEVIAVAVGGAAFVPVALCASCSSRVSPHADRIFVAAISVVGLSAVVAAIYLGVVLGLGSAPSSTADREVLGLSIVAAVVAALAFVPARDRILRLATSFVYGAREAPDEVVRSFGSRLTRAIPMDELLLQLAESLRKTLALATAEIYTGSGEVLDLAVSVPDLGSRSIVVSGRERPVITAAGVSGNAWASVWLPTLLAAHAGGHIRVAPISHAGELLGLIVVARAPGASGFSEEDDRVLTELARQVGLAFHNAQLDTALQSSLDELRRQAEELRASRARIVASGDAERRRVERNLHDGAQQHLVALAVNLRLAKDVVLEDPAAAAEMLDELGGAVQDTIKELRELAHGIYPPLLVDSGLGEALRAVCNRSPLDTVLSSEGIGRYESDVEAAVYFCCLEALQNAAKHAPEARVRIRIWEESGGLLFEVADDGPGFDVRLAKRGHGFVNMMDRLGAIGGSVRWQSAPGEGTVIRGSIPLR